MYHALCDLRPDVAVRSIKKKNNYCFRHFDGAKSTTKEHTSMSCLPQKPNKRIISTLHTSQVLLGVHGAHR